MVVCDCRLLCALEKKSKETRNSRKEVESGIVSKDGISDGGHR